MARKELGPAALQVSQAVRDMLDGVPRAVVGCSGGPDSMALALGARWAAGRTGTLVDVVIVDHRLQAGSDAVAARTAEELRSRGMSARVVAVDVARRGGDGPRAGAYQGGPESAARDARRRALAQAAGDAPVLLGHTLDDQAETVLLGLARGSGPTSLSGIRPHAGRFWHPLLGVGRATTAAACVEWGVTPWHDPQNDDPAFLRCRVRHETMPQLEAALGPGVAQALARTASLIQDDERLLEAVTRSWMAGNGVAGQGLPLRELASADPALARRVVKAWLDDAGVEAGFVHVEAVLALQRSEGGRGVDLPGCRVVRRGARLVLEAPGRDTTR